MTMPTIHLPASRPTPTAHAPVAPPATAAAPCPRWASQQLLGASPMAEIEHGGQIYRLRVTSLGKLIMTK